MDADSRTNKIFNSRKNKKHISDIYVKRIGPLFDKPNEILFDNGKNTGNNKLTSHNKKATTQPSNNELGI
jgi:hypothetical protein